jgi:glucokinase
VLTIGVDVGGTKVAAGVVDEAGTVLARTRRPTPSASPSDVEDVIATCVAELRRDHEVEAVGVGAAGFIDADRSRVFVAPNLSWRDEPLRDAVAARVGLPSWWRTTPTPRRGPSTGSAPGAASRTWSS